MGASLKLSCLTGYPFVVLLTQDCPDYPQENFRTGKALITPVRRLISLSIRSNGFVH